MSEKTLPIAQITLTLAALGITFWLGRVSASEPSEKIDETSESARSNTPRFRNYSSNRNSPGAGGQAVTTARQLHKLHNQGGSSATALALAKMNTSEIATLARNLAKKVESTSGYFPNSEINQTFTRWAEVDPEAALKFAHSLKLQSFQKSVIFQAIFNSLEKTAPALAHAKLAKISNLGLRKQLKVSLSRALAIADPDAWLHELKSDPTLSKQIPAYAFSAIAREWAHDDPATAATRIQQFPTGQQLKSIETISRIWASTDPHAALTWAQALDKPYQKSKAINAVLGGMATRNLDSALATLDSLSTTSRPAGISAIFGALASKDFETALAKAGSLTNPIDQRVAYKAMIASNNYSINLNAKPLRQLTEQLPAGALRNEALQRLGISLASFSPIDAQDYISSYSEKDQAKIKLQMINYLSYSNPHRAMKLYESMPAEKVESYLFSSIIRNVAKNDPEEALQIALKEKLNYQQANAMSHIFRELAATDPKSAQKHLEELPQGKARTKALESLAETWAKTDADSAIQWAESLPDAEQQKAVLSILPQMAKSSPEDAASYMETLLQSTPEKSHRNFSSAIYYMMNEWVQVAPASAGSWVNGLDDGSTKTQAIKNLASQWYQEDSNGVADWIDQLPQGKNRDNSISSIASNIQHKDPAAAFAWAESIGNDASRINQLSSIVRQWKSADPKKAQSMVNKADLTSDERTRLMKHFE